MREKLQIWRKFAERALAALSVLSLALCFSPSRSSAAIQTKKSKRPQVRHVRYRHYRRYWRHRVILPKAPSRDRTEEIQSALVRGGYYSGDPSGKWDSRTRDALMRFQEANGLTPTGKLDAISLQRLGLGSDIAGLSAPREMVPPSQSSTDSSTSSNPKSPGGR